MLIIPAIDLKDGQCVRLKKGLMDEATIFSKKPEKMAEYWLNEGAKRLHLVDLNGAFSGKPVNYESIKTILQVINQKIPVQLGGGIRDIKTCEYYFALGLDYLIIGTAGIENPDFMKEACNAFPNKIIAGLDANDGKVATRGWAVQTNIDVILLAKTFQDFGVTAVIYTDIDRDGMLSGVNISATEKLALNLKIPVIASGGLHNLSDVKALLAIEKSGVQGVIAGRSIYEGTLDLKTAQALAHPN